MALGVQKFPSVTALAVLRNKPCQVGKFQCISATANITHFQFFDAAATADVTLGTTVPDLVITAASAAYAMDDPGDLLAFKNGIVLACTTTLLGSTTSNAGHAHLWFG